MQVTANELVAYLNHLLELDQQAVENLFGLRVSCNPTMANHPSVQVRQVSSQMPCQMGVASLLNGIWGKPFLYMIFSGGRLVRFYRPESHDTVNLGIETELSTEENDVESNR